MERVSNNKSNNSILKSLSFSVFSHIALVGLLFSGALFADRTIVVDGDNSIKAIMIDLSMVASPEQSLVEDSPDIAGAEESKSVDNVIEEPPVEIEPEQDIVETIVEEKLDLSPEPKDIVKEVIEKPKEKPPVKPQVQQASKQQVRQEVLTNTQAEQAVAPSISDNQQFALTPSPVSRNQPEYPRRALDMRLEGYVVVLYDVNDNGRIENIRIIESKPNNIFDRSVINAMRMWKYQPIPAKDLTIKIIFNRNKSISMDSA